MTREQPSFVVLSVSDQLITRTVTPEETRELGALVIRDTDFDPTCWSRS
jgi:hypothetical protein